MHYYKLDDKRMDAIFLNGSLVSCKAVVPYDECVSGKVKQGERIVVMLSNGKKFMGRIVNFAYVVKNGLAIGDLEVVKEQTA